MRVFIVLEHIGHDGYAEIIAVHSSREQAEQTVASFPRFRSFRIEELEMDTLYLDN